MNLTLAFAILFFSSGIFACQLNNLKVIPNSHAKLFSVDDYDDGHLLTIRSPWSGEKKEIRYLLYRTKPVEEKNCRDIPQFKIPINRFVAFSTSYLPALKQLDKTDSLVAMVDSRYISDPQLKERVASGKIVSLGYPPHPERLLALKSDVVMAFVSESPELEGLTKLEQLKIPLVYNADFREKTPLARAEWIRFIAAFYDQEQAATDHFKKIEINYGLQKERVKKITEYPMVLLGEKRGDLWIAPAGGSYLDTYVREAAGRYLFSDTISDQPLQFPFERVFSQISACRLWITFSPWKSATEALAQDRRHQLLFKLPMAVFSGNKKMHQAGGNDYFETGALRPDLVLADFIAMIHPELGAGRLEWFMPIDKKAEKNQ